MKVKEMLTTDEGVFEFVKQHLLTQGQKSATITSCFYRQNNGLSCAVGCLIEDEFYNSGLEFHNGNDPIVLEAIKKSLPNWNINTDMLVALQEVHDDYEPEEWEHKLEYLERYLFDLENMLKEDDEQIRKLLNEN